jgi:hypothetical protein
MNRLSARNSPILQIARIWCLIKLLRRLFSILLLAAFSLPLVSPLFALGIDAETGLPACCRRNGKHHCMQSMAERANPSQSDTQIGALARKCPYCPQAIASAHTNPLANPRATADLAPLTSHPASIVQTESRRRISRDRSRQERGPPTILA